MKVTVDLPNRYYEAYERLQHEVKRKRIDCRHCGHRFDAERLRAAKGQDCPDCTFHPPNQAPTERRGDLTRAHTPDVRIRSLGDLLAEALRPELARVSGELQVEDWTPPD